MLQITVSHQMVVRSKNVGNQAFSIFLEFTESIAYDMVLIEQKNWYPDLSFVKRIRP